MAIEWPSARPVLPGSAGAVTFHDPAELVSTVRGGIVVPAGSVVAETLVLRAGDDGDADQTAVVLGAGQDSVSVGGIASIHPFPTDVAPSHGLCIDIGMLNLAGLDSAGPAMDGGAMHLAGGTRIDTLHADYVVQRALA